MRKTTLMSLSTSFKGFILDKGIYMIQANWWLGGFGAIINNNKNNIARKTGSFQV